MSREPDAITAQRRRLGAALATFRQAAGFSQAQFGMRTGYDRTSINKIEHGQQLPDRPFWQAADRQLHADGALLKRYDELIAAKREHAQRQRQSSQVRHQADAQRLRSAQPVTSALLSSDAADGPVAPARGAASLFEASAQVLGRRAKLYTGGLTEELLDGLEQLVIDVVERYEAEGPKALVPEVVQARQLVDELLAGNQRLRQRARLFELAAGLSGQLSYMAVNLGNFGTARHYGAEAFELARFIEQDELTAWVRGTQSLGAYYAGDYRQSVALAIDGQRYADGGIQAVRLTINGEARALGKMHDRRDAAAAIDRAYHLLEHFPPAPGMTPCISFGLYSEARVASNAATAYLTLGHTKQVLSYAERASQVVDVSSSQWSRALVRLDTAMALLTAARPEPEGASLLGNEAIAAVRDLRIESIQQRTHELATLLRPWVHLPSVADFLADADSWLATDWSGRGAE